MGIKTLFGLVVCLLVCFSIQAQLIPTNPFFVAGVLKPAAAGGGGGPALTNTGLIVRYYIDEAASGSTPTTVNDTSGVGSAMNLTIDYGSGNLAYIEVGGNRGLDSANTTGAQKARISVHDTSDKVRDALVGIKTGTIEIVVDGDSYSASTSRFFGVTDRLGGAGTFIIRSPDSGVFNLIWKGSSRESFNPGAARVVIHAVMDSAQAVDDDRCKVYTNGVFFSSSALGTTLDETLTMASGQDLIMFNRESSGAYDRSFNGILFYAAMYSIAFNADQVLNNSNILIVDDDTP